MCLSKGCKMVRVLVNGAQGKMGSQSAQAIAAHTGLELVGETDRGDDLRQAIGQCRADVVVDFTVASAGFKNTKIILESGARPVIGTSGFQSQQVEELQALAQEKKLGGVIAPNFAVGAVLMMKFAALAAQYLPSIEIVELHHDKKEESPSGTALRTAELIHEGRSKTPVLPRDRAVIPGARGALLHDIPIHSVRLPGLLAHQQVLCGGEGELLTIRHDSLNRSSFMTGVCLACAKAPQLQSLVYGLEHILV
jgi:4-hydroxy-tetrahydrodipicolinate reductase